MNTFIYACDQSVGLLLTTIAHGCCQQFFFVLYKRESKCYKTKNICLPFDSSPMTYNIGHQVLSNSTSKILLEPISFSLFLLALHNFSDLDYSKSLLSAFGTVFLFLFLDKISLLLAIGKEKSFSSQNVKFHLFGNFIFLLGKCTFI